MANHNGIISMSIRLEITKREDAKEALRSQRLVSVELDAGKRVILDPANKHSPGFVDVLIGLSELKLPAYFELDPEKNSVKRVLIPKIGYLVAFRETEKGFEFQLDTSHGRYLIKRDSSIWKEGTEALNKAQDQRTPIILTVDDANQILDIRPSPEKPKDFPEGPVIRREYRLRQIWWRIFYWRIWPWRWWCWLRCATPQRAQEIFDAMKALTCDPNAIASPCIPFLYPDDGCWGRAHEMRRLMLEMGVSSRKIWIFGSLVTPTRNNPYCNVYWGWHVAPTICVRRILKWWPWRLFCFTRRMVIDPSLFNTPVTPEQWKSAQGDPNATLAHTAGLIFLYWGNQTDNDYSKTNTVLASYRLALQNRVNQHGPPPYANCP